MKVYVFSGRETVRELLLTPESLAQEGSIMVLVRGSGSLRPLADAGMVLTSSIGEMAAEDTTGVDGIFRAEVDSGDYGLEVSLDGYETQLIDFEVVAGRETRLDMLLEPLNASLERSPAQFRITGAWDQSEVLAFQAGEEATLSFNVSNIGESFGQTEVLFDLPGVSNRAQGLFLEPGESSRISFTFTIPTDMDSRADVLSLTAGDQRYEVGFNVEGAEIEVEAQLDKEFYEEGETVRLSLNVTNKSLLDLELEARAQLAGHLVSHEFVMGAQGNATFDLDVPAEFTGDKLLFGIYQESGRSLYLNAFYVSRGSDELGLAADRQQYKPGERGQLVLDVRAGGKLTLHPPRGWEALTTSVDLEPGRHTIDFEVPEELAGTYLVDYTFQSVDGVSQGSVPVDVNGYRLKIKRVGVDRGTFESQGVVALSVNVEASGDKEVFLSAELLDAGGQVKGTIEESWALREGLNRVPLRIPISAAVEGQHSLVFDFRVDLPGHSLVSAASGVHTIDIMDLAAPFVLSSEPAPGAEGWPADGAISITFNEPVDKASVEEAFAISPSIEGVFSWSGNRMTFTPSGALEVTEYTVRVSEGALDLSGNQMAPVELEFTTGAASAEPTVHPTTTPTTPQPSMTPTGQPTPTAMATMEATPTPTPGDDDGTGGGNILVWIVVAVVGSLIGIGGAWLIWRRFFVK
jgi:hypothetical protein